MPSPADFFRRTARKRRSLRRFWPRFASTQFGIWALLERTLNTYCGAVRAVSRPKGADLAGRLGLLRLQSRSPTPRLRVGWGRCTDLGFPNAPEDDERGGGAYRLSLVSALWR